MDPGGMTAQREPGVVAAMKTLNSQIESLASILGDLQARLKSVLTPMPPSPIGNKKEADGNCPLIIEIQHQSDKILSLRHEVEATMSSLEI